MSSGEQLIRDFGKLAVFVDRGLLTGREYVSSLLDTLGWADCCPELVPVLWEAVPVAVRVELRHALREVLLPEFHWHAYYTTGFDVSEDEQSRRDAAGTARIRAWAIEFLRLLDDGEELRESIVAIEQGLADAESGRT